MLEEIWRLTGEFFSCHTVFIELVKDYSFLSLQVAAYTDDSDVMVKSTATIETICIGLEDKSYGSVFGVDQKKQRS